jgi:hypothetical protein
MQLLIAAIGNASSMNWSLHETLLILSWICLGINSAASHIFFFRSLHSTSAISHGAPLASLGANLLETSPLDWKKSVITL